MSGEHRSCTERVIVYVNVRNYVELVVCVISPVKVGSERLHVIRENRIYINRVYIYHGQIFQQEGGVIGVCISVAVATGADYNSNYEKSFRMLEGIVIMINIL